MGNCIVIKGADFSKVAVKTFLQKVKEINNCFIDINGIKVSRSGYSVAVFNIEGISKVRVEVDELGVGNVSWLATYTNFANDNFTGFLNNSKGAIDFSNKWALPYSENFVIPKGAKYLTVSLGKIGEKGGPELSFITTQATKNVRVIVME